VAFCAPVEFSQKKYTNLFTGVKYTVTSQMNYVRRLLISKNDNFNQHFTTSFRVAI